MVRIRDEHYFNGDEEMFIDFEELFQLYNQDTIDKTIVSCYCLLKILEFKSGQIYDIGFTKPNIIHEVTVQKKTKETEDNLLKAFIKQQNKREILFPYNFKFHFILLVIQFDAGKVLVMDSKHKDPAMWVDLSEMLQRV